MNSVCPLQHSTRQDFKRIFRLKVPTFSYVLCSSLLLFLVTSCAEPDLSNILDLPINEPVSTEPQSPNPVTTEPVTEPVTEPIIETPVTEPDPVVSVPNPVTLPEPMTVSRLWSNSETWNGSLPKAGEVVTIAADQTVILDGTTPPLGGLNILGKLILEGSNIHLTSNWITVKGQLLIGTQAQPFMGDAVITLTGKPQDSVDHIGNRVIAVMDGGTFEVFAEAPAKSWTKLARNAEAGSSQLTLEDNITWQVGDTIVVASSDYDFEQAEERIITAINGKTIQLNKALTYIHWGELQTIAGQTIDTRAEVAVLSRNVRIESINDTYMQQQGFGGHIMAMPNSDMKLDGIELKNMGQRGVTGRYPIHWHQAGNAQGDFVKRTSIHHSFNRCITIHGAHNVLIQETVAYESFGHCFFLEDGIEQGNRFDRVLGMSIRKPSNETALLPTDTIDPGPAVFWITNPDNSYTNNVAAGSEGSGFWFGLPEHPTGPSATTTVSPRSIPLAGFNKNTAHSNQFDALHVDRGPSADTLEAETTYYVARTNPNDITSTPIPSVFENFTAFKTRRRGVWLRGEHLVVRGGTFSDNAIGVTMAAGNNAVEKSVFIGESANKGTPASGEATGPDGRSLPLPIDTGCEQCADKVIRGFEVYDGTSSASSSLFANYIPNSLREAAALSQLDFTEFEVSPENWVSDITISPESKSLYFFDPNKLTGQTDGYQSTVFIDKDGSLTGKANQSIVVNQPILLSDSCINKAEWNAWVCDEHYVALRFDTVDMHLDSVALNYEGVQANTMVGMPDSNTYKSNMLPNTERWYSYNYSERPAHTRINMFNMQSGDFVKFSLPFTENEAFVYRDRRLNSDNRLSLVDSMKALEESTGDSYYRSNNRLYMKLQARPDFAYAAFDICTTPVCGINQ